MKLKTVSKLLLLLLFITLVVLRFTINRFSHSVMNSIFAFLVFVFFVIERWFNKRFNKNKGDGTDE